MSVQEKSAGEGKGLYYGWVIVAVMATAGAVSMAMGSLNFGLFIKPMGDTLGIGRAWFGWAQTVRQVSSAVTSPPVGWLIDRYGSRVMLPVAAIVTASAMVALSFLNDASDAGDGGMFPLWAGGMSGPGAVTSVLECSCEGGGDFLHGAGIRGAMVFVPLNQMLTTGGVGACRIIFAAIGSPYCAARCDLRQASAGRYGTAAGWR